jgi:hypothetical protein
MQFEQGALAAIEAYLDQQAQLAAQDAVKQAPRKPRKPRSRKQVSTVKERKQRAQKP